MVYVYARFNVELLQTTQGIHIQQTKLNEKKYRKSTVNYIVNDPFDKP